ncbi:MAG: hypothetical protein ACT4P7_03195 [Gemmatimonadaceae bacterium]
MTGLRPVIVFGRRGQRLGERTLHERSGAREPRDPTGQGTAFDLPRHPALSNVPGGPIPYEIRVAPNGIVWMSELGGNRIVSLDPATRQTRALWYADDA